MADEKKVLDLDFELPEGEEIVADPSVESPAEEQPVVTPQKPADNKPAEIEYISKWINEIGGNVLNEEECRKVMEYAKFLVSIRED